MNAGSGIIGIAIGGLVLAGFILIKIKDWRSSLTYNLRHIQGFRPAQHLFGQDGKTALAIDDASAQICLLTKQRRGKSLTRIIPYAELLSSEILEDGTSVMRTSRSSQAGGAIVGGVIGAIIPPLGCLGFLIGGLTGKKVSDDIVNRLDLVLVLNDTTAPRFEVNLLHVKTKKSKALYRVAIQKARHWHSVFDAVIKRAQAVAPMSALASPASTFTFPPQSPTRFFLYLGDEVKGPYLLSQVELLRDAGTVTQETLICREGAEEWSPWGAFTG